MARETLLGVGIVLLLILVQALLVAAEIALVSLRESQVRALADRGRRGAVAARLAQDPNRVLGAVQVGVTTAVLLSSALAAALFADDLQDAFARLGPGRGAALALAVLVITAVLAGVTLVVGELVPKRLGLQRAEGTALLTAPLLHGLAAALRPVMWGLTRVTDGLVRVLGGDPDAGRQPISDEELRGLVAAHESLSTDERRLIDDVFAAGERAVDEVMVPRTEVVFLEAAMTISRAAKIVADTPHSRYPVVGRGHDDVLGFAHIRDLLFAEVRHDRNRAVASVTRPIKALPGSKHVLAALSEMRREGNHMALVVDEYGGTDGIVTLEDLIEEVIGDIRDEYDQVGVESRRLAGGAVEVDGKLNLDEIAEITGCELPEGPYTTLGGYVMAELGRLAQPGDVVDCDGFRLTVTSVQGRRAARITVTPPL